MLSRETCCKLFGLAAVTGWEHMRGTSQWQPFVPPMKSYAIDDHSIASTFNSGCGSVIYGSAGYSIYHGQPDVWGVTSGRALFGRPHFDCTAGLLRARGGSVTK